MKLLQEEYRDRILRLFPEVAKAVGLVTDPVAFERALGGNIGLSRTLSLELPMAEEFGVFPKTMPVNFQLEFHY